MVIVVVAVAAMICLVFLLCYCYREGSIFPALVHCFFLLLFFSFVDAMMGSSKLALRVLPAVTRLTVYRWLHIYYVATFDLDFLRLLLFV